MDPISGTGTPHLPAALTASRSVGPGTPPAIRLTADLQAVRSADRLFDPVQRSSSSEVLEMALDLQDLQEERNAAAQGLGANAEALPDLQPGLLEPSTPRTPASLDEALEISLELQEAEEAFPELATAAREVQISMARKFTAMLETLSGLGRDEFAARGGLHGAFQRYGVETHLLEKFLEQDGRLTPLGKKWLSSHGT